MDAASSALRVLADPEADGELAIAGLPKALACYAAEVVDGAEVSVVMSDQQGAWHVVSASSEAARELTLVQLVRGDGPCFEVLKAVASRHVADLGRSGRYPALAQAALDRGISSIFAAPLSTGPVTIGALCVFGGTRTCLDRRRPHIEALAELAALALSQGQATTQTQRRVHELEHALAVRIVIEQAKGMLAERAHADLPSVFGSLVRYARERRWPLGDCARDVVTGRLDLDEVLRGWRPTGTADDKSAPAAPGARRARTALVRR